MNKRFLGHLARRLEKIQATPKKKRERIFDFNTFFQENTKDPAHSCNTAACALGEACFIPSLRRAGLSLGDGSVPQIGEGAAILGGYSAGATLFNISHKQSSQLFSPAFYLPGNLTDEQYSNAASRVTPGRVARRIRQFIKTGKV